MLIDYKWWYVRRDDDGYITEAAVRFYEGEVSTADELHHNLTTKQDELVSVTRYRRTNKLNPADLKYLKSATRRKDDENGVDAEVYTEKDFGRIKTDDELREFCNSEIAKDLKRSPIDQQKK